MYDSSWNKSVSMFDSRREDLEPPVVFWKRRRIRTSFALVFDLIANSFVDRVVLIANR